MDPISSTTGASPFSGIFYNWEESRNEDSFHVTCKNTNQTWTIGDSPLSLRFKFLELATVGVFLQVTYVFLRTMTLLSGNFITYAKMQAKHDWINSLDCEKDDAYDRYKIRFYKAVPLEFLKEVGKTLLMTVAIVPTTLIGIFGIIFPYDGRKLMGDLSQLYAPTRFNTFASPTPCMPDQSYRDRETLHDRNKRDKVCQINYKLTTKKARILNSYKEYFEKKNVYTDLEYSQLRGIINDAKGRGSDERSLKIFLHKQGDYRNPKDIKVLDLCFKNLKELPKSLKHLENVQELDLSNNQLTDIGVLVKLKKLTHIRLSFNSITNIDDLFLLPKECTINLDNNPLSEKVLASLKEKISAPNYQGPKIRFAKPL